MTTRQGFARVAALLAMGAIVPLVMANDLDNFCDDWEEDCPDPPMIACTPDAFPTGDYGLDFEVHHHIVGQFVEQAYQGLTRITNNNPGIRVKFHMSGTSYNKNMYFQNDARDESTCDTECEFPNDPPGLGCTDPPCHFEGECCYGGQTCQCAAGTCPAQQSSCNSCEVLEDAKTCGCEMEALPHTLEIAGAVDDKDVYFESCAPPSGGAGDGLCDIPAQAPKPYHFCIYPSPGVDQGA